MAVDTNGSDTFSFMWNILPYQILKNIYSYLNNEGINISCVCRHWRSVIYTNRSYWKKLHITPQNYPHVDILTTDIPVLKIVEEIVLEFDPFTLSHLLKIKSILQHLKCNSNLHSISLRTFSCDANSKEPLIQTLYQPIKELIDALSETIANADSLMHFDWGSGILVGQESNRVLTALELHQSRHLSSLSIVQLFYYAHYSATIPMNLDFNLFPYCNLKLLTANYRQLSEDLIILLSKKSLYFENLNIILQNSIRNLPVIRNQVWRYFYRKRPNLKIHLYLLRVCDINADSLSTPINHDDGNNNVLIEQSEDDIVTNDVPSLQLYNAPSHYLNLENQEQQQQHHPSFIVPTNDHHHHHHQTRMNELLTYTNVLPFHMPLTSVYLYHCKPNPLVCFIQYIRHHFAATLEAFYIVDSFEQSAQSQTPSLSTSLLSVSSPTRHDVGDWKDCHFDLPSICGHDDSRQECSPTSGGSMQACTSQTTYSSTDLDVSSCSSNDCSVLLLPTDVDDTWGRVDVKYCRNDDGEGDDDDDGNKAQWTNTNTVRQYQSSKLLFNEMCQRLNVGFDLQLTTFYLPSLYKSVNDINPDPFVLLAWKCKKLSRFTMFGYWFNISDMRAFTALRGSTLKCFQVPQCCILIDDQSYTNCLDDDLQEISRNLTFPWSPTPVTDLPISIFAGDNIEPVDCFNQLIRSNELEVDCTT